jgi:hypothetical protein
MSLQRKLGINEYYCPLIDYPNYAVSNYGNVKNRITNKLLKPKLNKHGYLVVILVNDKKRYDKSIHRLVITTFENNSDNKKCVDHIDNNKLNNELFNLRFATHSENSHNAKLSKRNTSGNKGITFDKQTNKWRALICLNYKFVNIGRFEKLEDAIKARQEKAKELFGEFLNNCEK